MGFPSGTNGKKPIYQCRRHKMWVRSPGSGRSLGEGNGNLLQYSCLEMPMDRGAWQATVHAVTQSPTQLKRLSTHTFIHIFFSQSGEGFYFLEN